MENNAYPLEGEQGLMYAYIIENGVQQVTEILIQWLEAKE
ncbi:hypothetical protein HMPREF0083_06181 [Aneurinibacillus aneurinilyticus ATCC 12856]|jgi:hypothetical protein|uniref:Uncharacterized protein n=1 Tax=Aneurinibacillus aneurinilyticus ATCC 12856 TaxID=649747 RepID=U1WP31_ANEAE|nr:hypothetical protein HMPREF0083_06181 [Aneurinibacillus aneurinilyticus ATCC 12856]